MADTSNDEGSDHQIDGNSQPSMHETEPASIPRYMRGHLTKDFDDYQAHQQIQITKETLKFLQKSRKFKRPPQSIRISGANVVEEEEKLKLFSKFETEAPNWSTKLRRKRMKLKNLREKQLMFLL